MTASRPIQAPKGTRDFYPEEMLRRRYITDAWRRTALRHGFDEIDGPVFEHRELYEKKSGEGILNEMFSVFSGKDPGQREALQRGEQAPFGLRPEFTPTLARMYAAKARQLPSPCKWFCVSNFFRAERPQRGRLREFFQWNCDVVGGEAIEEPGSKSFTSAGRFDHEIIETQVGLLDGLGFSHESLQIRASNRRIVDKVLGETLREPGNRDEVFALLDARKKLDANQFLERAFALKFDVARFDSLLQYDKYKFSGAKAGVASAISHEGASPFADMDTRALAELFALCHQSLIYEWVDVDPTIVRGLAYYTGTVFEVIAEGERAVAGGGRYDNLIELFGGPPTPACGFGMGDVVLENLLNDHNLMPTGRDLVRALSEPMPVRPDVFIVTNGDAGAEQQIVPALAALRRGALAEGQREPWDPNRYTIPPIHARRTYKATNKIGKLKADAAAQHARLFVILESDERCTVQDLDGIADERRDVPIAELSTVAAAMLKA